MEHHVAGLREEWVAKQRDEEEKRRREIAEYEERLRKLREEISVGERLKDKQREEVEEAKQRLKRLKKEITEKERQLRALNEKSNTVSKDRQASPESSCSITGARIGGNITNFSGRGWRVLDVQSGKALLLSEKIIEKRAYHPAYVNTTWAESELRAYLNGAFFNSFGQDKARIAETRITTDNNPWFGTQGGNAMNDRIFLLSLEEVAQYLGDSGQLKNRPKNESWIVDQYNSARIAADESGKESRWWLRSPGGNSSNAAFVLSVGIINVYGGSVSLDSGGVRPALWLNL